MLITKHAHKHTCLAVMETFKSAVGLLSCITGLVKKAPKFRTSFGGVEDFGGTSEVLDGAAAPLSFCDDGIIFSRFGCVEEHCCASPSVDFTSAAVESAPCSVAVTEVEVPAAAPVQSPSPPPLVELGGF